MKIIVVRDVEDVIESLRQQIEKISSDAVETRGTFRVGLSGGSMVNYLSRALFNTKSDLTKWQCFFCDERFVPDNDKDSNFGSYIRALIPRTSMKTSQFACIDTGVTMQQCADDYEERILEAFNVEKAVVPRFDLLLLGMGPDGHTCSLFPGHALLEESHKLIRYIDDAPKPPPRRVTMTLPLINNASCVIFVICGEDKADMVKRVFVDKEPLPAGMVKPIIGDLICILDEAAAECIK